MAFNISKFVLKKDDIELTIGAFDNVPSAIVDLHTINIDDYIITYELINSVYESNIGIDESSLTPIKLIENAEYFFEYKRNNVDDYLSTIRSYNTFFKGSRLIENKIFGSFNSNNYIGKLNLSFLGFDNSNIEIISKKIDYESDFNTMMTNINDLFIEYLSRSNSIFSSSRSFTSMQISDEKYYYSKFAYIENILGDNNIPFWIDYLEKNHNSKLESKKESKYINELDDIDIDEIMDASTSDNVFQYKNRNIPYIINDIYYEEEKNTKENQFVKFFIENLKNELMKIKKMVDSDLEKDCNYLIKKINALLSKSFFKGISNISNIPYNSQVLQKKYPYNLIFKTYNNLQLITKIDNNLIFDTYNVGHKDVPTLYEYWCFLQVHKLLDTKYNESEHNSWISYNSNKLDVSINHGSYSSFEVGDNIKVFLYYNKTYNSISDPSISESYSQEFRPDISLEIYKNDNLVSLLHLDAKYKLPSDNDSFNSDDLNKMHAYKDGIIGTRGAFILTLGSKKSLFYKPLQYEDFSSSFPSVGALSLIPGHYNDDLEKLIISYLDLFRKDNFYEQEV